MLRMIFLITIFHASSSIVQAQGQSLVKPPINKVVKEPFIIYYSYFDDEAVEVSTRIYDPPSDAGQVMLNAIHIRGEEPGFGALIYEYIYEDKYVHSLNLNRSKLYFITMDKFPNGKEAILLYRKKDRKLIAIIGKQESGAWDTGNNESLNALVRKYHPELNK